MANETQEPRALSAALAAPVFHTRGGGSALHAANRHVERWAPEATASRVRSMRTLSFVDRLVAPWIETAQRSASLRLFSQYARSGPSEREGGAVSWVFPRPWYQDELDWMAAARQARSHSAAEQAPAPTMLTTRGTYVPAPRAQTFQPAMPSALYEYVAPSLSIAQPTQSIEGVGHGGRSDAYSPLVSLAAVQAAELMSRTVAPRTSSPSGTSTTVGRISPALRSVLTTMLERASIARTTETAPTRSSMYAPEMVTPPAPRPESVAAPQLVDRTDGLSPSQLADRYAEQRTRVVELQRMARQSEAARIETARIAESTTSSPVPASSQPAAQVARTEAVRAEITRTMEARVQAARTEAEQRTADRGQQQVNEAQQRLVQAERAQGERVLNVERAQAERTQNVERAQAERTQNVERAQAERAQNVERAQVERARIEEKIAQRGGAQRLHEQSRVDAAAHAKIASLETAAATAAAAPATPVYRQPPEVTAQIAGLPPELAAYLMHRPERGMQVFAELNEVLRTAELLARSAASNVPFEATRGPRVMMPAGIGGLVAAVDRAQLIADRPAQLAGARAAQPMIGQPMAAPTRAPARPERDVRVPTLSWLAGPSNAPRMSPASTTALGATASSAPAGLSHVAWADRWLARFAGAAPQSLDVLQAAAAGSPQLRMQALAASAPGEVFVAPIFDTETMRTRAPMPIDGAPFTRSQPAQMAQTTSSSSSSSSAPGMPTLIQPSTQGVERYDDSAETPDDVFLQIAAAAGRKRASVAAPMGAPQSAPTSQEAAPSTSSQSTTEYERYTRADAIAHAAPSAPGAGMSAQLASSPFAAALRHVLPLPAAASFDVRSLFGSGLSATYLAGLLAPESYEMDVAGAATSPLWASWGAADAMSAPIEREREAPSFDATYVSPEADLERAREIPGMAEIERAREIPGMAELIASGAVTSNTVSSSAMPYAAGSPASAAAMAAAMEPLTTLRTALLSWTMTMESGASGAQTSFIDAPSISTGQSAPITTAAARAMIESMSLPMLGGEASPTERMASWGAPGMLAERAQDWSVAQERSASDLSLDFVTPELVLAARVYGLGPAEAAQAARLAIAGPGHLTAMAGAVDRTFVQAMAIEADRREGRMSGMSGYGGGGSGSTGSSGTSSSSSGSAGPSPSSYSSTSASGMTTSDLAAMSPAQRTALTTAYPTATGDIALVEAGMLPRYSSPGAAFGVERRAPRGAFLWPSATVAALGLNAALPDGQQSMPLAALELLAAQAVAEIGTYAALGDYSSASAGAFSAGEAFESSTRVEQGSAALDPASGDRRASMSSMAMPNVGGAMPNAGGAMPNASGAIPSLGGGAAAASISEPGEADVLGAAAALIPASRRARFDALYVALSQSSTGRTWSPASRAARALALANRGDDAPTSSYERAATAWDVLPVVYATDGMPYGGGADSAPMSTGTAHTYALSRARGGGGGGGGAPRGSRAAGSGGAAGRAGASMDFVEPMITVDGRPGLGALSARAGEALGSYVSPAAYTSSSSSSASSYSGGSGGGGSSSSSSSSSYSQAPAARAPSAAQELVRTGRPSGRHGGGEVEIPSWFETAARKMLEDRSGNADGISMAELTLVNNAPSSHVAASTRTASVATSTATQNQKGKSQDDEESPIDIDKTANEVYRQILTMMDSARLRNGH